MTKVRVLAVVAVFTAFALTGCAGVAGADVAATSSASATVTETAAATAEAAATASPTATPSATATTTSTASPPATASAGKPALEDLKLSSEGIGYVRIGQAVPEVPKDERIVEWKDNFCDFTGDGEKPGAWDTQYRTKDNGNLQFYVQAYPDKSSPVSAIYVLSDKIHTEHGLGIGSTLDEVKALGGVKEKTKTGADFYLDPWVIHGSAGELVFWITNDTGEKADRDIVQNVEVIAEGSEPAFAFEITPCE